MHEVLALGVAFKVAGLRLSFVGGFDVGGVLFLSRVAHTGGAVELAVGRELPGVFVCVVDVYCVGAEDELKDGSTDLR